MAGNEEHPFASIVAAYRESQPPALDTDEAAAEAAPVESPTLATPPAAESVETPAVAAVAAEEPAAVEPTLPQPTEPTAVEPAAEAEVVEEPAADPEDVTGNVSEADKPSALVDPFKSILAAYYAQSVDDVAAPKVAPAQAVEPAQDVESAPIAEESVAAEPEPAVAETVAEPAAEHEPPAEPIAADPEPAVVETRAAHVAHVQEPAADETAEAHATGTWGRHAIPAAATGAAASVLAAYYADPPETVDEASVAEPEAIVADPSTADVAAADVNATAVLPAVTATDFRNAPSNPLGSQPASGAWGAQALAAAGSTSPIEPVNEALPAAVQHRATEFIDNAPAEDEKDSERSEARRKFLMLAPIAAIAAVAVLAVLLWNGDKSTPKSAPSQVTTAPIILAGSPLRRTQEAYTSVLNRFNNANDAGGAVVAGGAAHDTLKLLKDFTGASARDKALLAAERAHLTALSGLAAASPSSFGGAAGQAKHTLAAVQKAAAADPKAGAPNSSAATSQAIDLLGEGNVTKLQVALNSLIARSDSASLTSQLRGVASDAAGNADAANSLASVIKNPSVQTTASSLANKFSSMAPMARLNGGTLSDWSTIRPGMVSAMGLDPVTHVDSLIANARQALAAWAANQSNQNNNASIVAINAYANAMRSHFGAFGGALSQIPSLNSGESCSAGAKDGTRSRAGNAALAVNNAAFGGNPPASLVAAHNALVNAVNAGTTAATAGQNVTVLCGSGTYGSSSYWGTYSGNIWVKGGWSGRVGAWEAAVSAAISNAKTAGATPKPIV